MTREELPSMIVVEGVVLGVGFWDMYLVEMSKVETMWTKWVWSEMKNEIVYTCLSYIYTLLVGRRNAPFTISLHLSSVDFNYWYCDQWKDGRKRLILLPSNLKSNRINLIRTELLCKYFYFLCVYTLLRCFSSFRNLLLWL